MGEEAGRRRTRDFTSSEDGPSTPTVATRPGQSSGESQGVPPDPKRRKPPSPSPDRAAIRTSATEEQVNPELASLIRSDIGLPQHGQHPTETSPHSQVTSHQYNDSNHGRRASDSARSDTGVARLPSLASIAQDLPLDALQPAVLPRRQHASPLSAQSTRSRASISSRDSSPHASSSSSSSGPARRRFGSIAHDAGVLSRSASQMPELRYELIIQQQPGTAAAAGLSPTALSRLPIVPSPIIQLRVTDGRGETVDHRQIISSLPYLVCSCALLSNAEDSHLIDFAAEISPSTNSTNTASTAVPARRPSQPLAMLCGTRVYSSSEARGLNGQAGLFFVFWDISVRQEGEYRLKFNLVEALPGSPVLAIVISEPFKVVQRSGFPGEVEMATDWTRHMHRQGINIYLPALGTATLPAPSANSRQ